jgi:aquacobalamin reductase/NAD(P)H-flavin reductase
MTAITCKVTKLDKVNKHVYLVELDAKEPLLFAAGQYLQVVMNEKDKRPFSIASAPGGHSLQLHIGATEGNSYATEVIDQCVALGELTVEVGFGNAQLKEDSDRPVILLAGGTGFSYVQSIALQLAHIKPGHKVLLYWGGRHPQDLYARQAMGKWERSHNARQFIPVVEHPDDHWQGKTGYVHKAVLDDINNLNDYDIYAAGHFNMLKAVRDDFVAHGALIDHLFSDAFTYI